MTKRYYGRKITSRRKRKHSRKRKTHVYRRRRSMHGGADPVLPPLQTPFPRNRLFGRKPVLPPIGESLNVPEANGPRFSTLIPDWRNRRRTFVEMQGHRHRAMSGQFHYPSRKSRYTPWERVKYLFTKDKRPYPPVFA